MWPEIIYGGYLVGSWAYHKWKDSEPKPKPAEVLKVPATEAGGSIPILFGKCRINQPLIAWYGNRTAQQDGARGDGFFYYTADALYIIGIPFHNGGTRLHSVFVRGNRIRTTGAEQPATLYPDGLVANLGTLLGIAGPDPTTNPDYVSFLYEFGDGNSSQDLGVGSNTAARMVVAGILAGAIPGFRGQAVVGISFLSINAPEVPAIAFEISTYPLASTYLDHAAHISGRVGDEANPALVIAAILCDRFGKLGLSRDVLDHGSFRRAAETLAAEGHGYSRAFEERMSSDDMLREVLEQIDGVLFEEPTTGKIVLRLIRADYDPVSLPTISPATAISLDDFNAGWGANVVNKIVINFPNRGNAYTYEEDQATAQNMANAVGQDGITRELVLRYPGVCTKELAESIAARELAARSRPIMKCRAVVGSSFWNIRPGDAVNVLWPAYHVSNVVFRVVGVNRGAHASKSITLDLVQDFFYVYRQRVHTGDVAPNPTPPIFDADPE